MLSLNVIPLIVFLEMFMPEEDVFNLFSSKLQKDSTKVELVSLPVELVGKPQPKFLDFKTTCEYLYCPLYCF